MPEPGPSPRAFDPLPWRRDAACVGETQLFYAPEAERPEARHAREHWASRLCDRCPVVAECRDHARRNREYGYWGGESEEERAERGFAPDMPIGAVAAAASRYRRAKRAARQRETRAARRG